MYTFKFPIPTRKEKQFLSPLTLPSIHPPLLTMPYKLIYFSYQNVYVAYKFSLFYTWYSVSATVIGSKVHEFNSKEASSTKSIA